MNASFQRIASITVCAVGLVLHASSATANCNVIPGANGSFRGALGSTDRPFAIPGDPVEIALAPGICDGETTAFVEQPGGATRADDYRVTLLFTPSQGVRNAVVVATDCSLLGAGSAPIAACNAQLGGGTATCVQAPAGNFAVSDALHLTFPFPDTDARVGAADDDRTLSGPVKIVVTPSSAALPCQFATQRCATGLSGIAACIDELYADDGTCRVGSTDIDPGFGHFVALPPPNSLQSLATQAGSTEAHFTIDAAGNVLLPMDYQSVLVRIEGRPFPRLTRGGSSIDAFTALAGNNVIDIPGRAFISSWSPEGIRLPPVFEPLADPNSTSEATIFGTVDAPLGVIRIARRQPVLAKCVGGSNPGTPCDSASTCSSGGACTSIVTPEYRMCTGGGNHPCLSNGDCGAATCGAAVCYVGASATATACTTDAQCTQPNARCGPSLFDFSDRSGPGPVVVAPGLYSADLEQPVTLEGTKETQSLLSFVVPELIDGVSRNGDLDATDPVLVLRDRATGLVQNIGPGQTSEGRAVSTAYQAPFQFSAVAVEGDLVVFTEPEALQNNCPWALGCDQTGDQDTFDHLLRVHRLGQSAPVYLTPQIPVDIEPVIEGRSIAISDDLVFFRTREADAGIRQTVPVSLTSGSGYANSSSDMASISETGTQVAFRSAATNLVSSDTNATYDVFVRDRDVDRDGIPEFGQTNTIRVSVSTVGTQANGPSQETAISDSGRFVAFASAATNLIASDTNGVLDYFVRDRDSDADGLFDEIGGVATTRISVSTAGLQANGGPSTGSLGISGNGRFIVFASQASNLVSGDTNGQPDVFLRDRDTDADNLFDEAGAVATTRISIATDGTQANDYSFEPRISDDGRHVCFFSAATNLTGTDANGIVGDVYVRDRDTDRDGVLDEAGAVATVRVSVSSDGVQPSVGASSGCDISDDGRIVAFQSSATTLVGGDTNGSTDIIAYDRDVDGDGIYDEPGAIAARRVSVASTGIQGDNGGYAPRLNSNGRFVAFASASTNLVGGDANGSDDAFVHDRTSGVTERLSIDNNGLEASNLFSTANAEAAGDSRDTAFQFGGNLGISDLNGFGDIYDRGIDRSAGFCSRDVTGDCDFADSVLRVLDTRVVSPTPLLLGNASRVAVAAGNAIFLDPVNLQLKLYRDRTPPVANLLSPGIEVAASNTFVAATFYEGVDSYNGDFDFFDPVAMIAQVATASAFNLVIPALAAERLQLHDTLDGTGVSSYDALEGVAAFVTAESLQGDLDVTQDGESADRTLSVVALDAGATVPTATQLPVVDSQSRRQPVEDFVLGSEIVAFRTRENAFCDNSFGPNTGPACASECPSATPQASCGGATTYSCDLNCDGDCCDDVLNAFDLVAAASGSQNALVSSGRTVEPCRLEACDPLEPYKVIGSTVRFLEDERQQDEDLNNDGDATDLVVQVFNVQQGAVRAISAVRASAPSEAKVGPNPLDPGSAGGSGGGAGGGMVAVTDGRCIANTSTPCSACDNGEFCGANSLCQHDYGTCRTSADCPVGTAAVCDIALVYTAAASDRDGDSLPDPVDNCPRDANLDQHDADGDGVGDACDFETCGNSLVELTEECDDGDTQSGDACSSACRIESGPCDDGVDNDGDGLVDFGADPGCKTAASPKENPRCDDGIDNDGDGKADWDGAGLGPADPQCAGKPERDGEASSCGLGAELVLVLAVLLRRRARVG